MFDFPKLLAGEFKVGGGGGGGTIATSNEASNPLLVLSNSCACFAARIRVL